MTDKEIIYHEFGNVVKNPFRETKFIKMSYNEYRFPISEKDSKPHHYGLIIAIVFVILMLLL